MLMAVAPGTTANWPTTCISSGTGWLLNMTVPLSRHVNRHEQRSTNHGQRSRRVPRSESKKEKATSELFTRRSFLRLPRKDVLVNVEVELKMPQLLDERARHVKSQVIHWLVRPSTIDPSDY